MKLFAIQSVALFLATWTSSLYGQDDAREFHVWATSCSHVPADIVRGRESLALAIRQSEGRIDGAPAFDWDIMIDAGDLSASQFPPEDRDGMELQRQYRALQKHRREQVYNVPGNHDAPYYDHGPGSWFRKWGDPLGEFTEFSGVDAGRRPFAVEGNWERYRFVAGNVLFLMLADRNDAPAPVGRGHSSEKLKGGYPPGAVTRDTFEWWKQQVMDNQDKIIVTMHHHMLRDTTTASGYGEGNPRYHGSSGGAEGSSYLYFLIENDDPENFEFTADAHVFEGFLAEFEKANAGRGAIDFWIGGHTHMKSPEDDHGDKTISERLWGVNFLQAAALTKHHGGGQPLSRLLSFRQGAAEALVQTYLHEARGEELPIGFYDPVKKTMPLRHAFVAPPEIEPMAPFPDGVEEFEPQFQKRVPSRSNGGAANIKAEPSVDLLGRWDHQQSGRLFLESQVENDAENRIGNKPKVISKGAPGSDSGKGLEFDGSQRLRIGAIDVGQWTDLSVCAWVRSTVLQLGMRVVSKDRLGEPGCFMLLHLPDGAWTFRAWDVTTESWRTATWIDADAGADDQWHHLVGVVDSDAGKTRLFVDGQLRAEASWSAETLDDSDAADVVVGADSGEERFGAGFAGQIADLRLLAKPLSAAQVAEMFEER